MLKTLLIMELILYLLIIDMTILAQILSSIFGPAMEGIGVFIYVPLFFILLLFLFIIGIIIFFLFIINGYKYNVKDLAIKTFNYIKSLINFKLYPIRSIFYLIQLIIILVSIPEFIYFIYLFIYNATYHG